MGSQLHSAGGALLYFLRYRRAGSFHRHRNRLPVPFGLLYEEASAIIEAVANKGSIVGMDMVEISPPCDHQNMTSMYGAQLMLDAMSFLTKARKNGVDSVV